MNVKNSARGNQAASAECPFLLQGATVAQRVARNIYLNILDATLCTGFALYICIFDIKKVILDILEYFFSLE